MLDGDDSISQEPLCRPNRPDHLDFLRITPPEDDIIGDTPYYPKLGVTVSQSRTQSCLYNAVGIYPTYLLHVVSIQRPGVWLQKHPYT